MPAVRLSEIEGTRTLSSGARQRTLSPLRTAGLVALGGAVGAVLRICLALLVPTVTTPTLVEIPWATLWANALGCLGLGVLTGVLEVRTAAAWVRPLLGVGVCGGFTTLSGVVLEGSAMIGAAFPLTAVSYALLTAVICVGALILGLLVARRIACRGTAGDDA